MFLPSLRFVNLYKKFITIARNFKLTVIDFIWYKKNPLAWLFWPISLIYQSVAFIRRNYLQIFSQHKFDIPIIVVGNISVGGVGKTPLVIAIADKLRERGMKVGIVSRGYGASVSQFPYEVKKNDSAQLVGDEPLLLALRTNCHVVIAPKRIDAVRYLLDNYQIDIIISDDGLQHYALGRALEIAVLDGTRLFGNGFCIPAGPLRESRKRLKKVDLVVINGLKKEYNLGLNSIYNMKFIPGQLTNLSSCESVFWQDIESPIAAVAGIGNPDRFFATLKELGAVFKPYYFADHHKFQKSDFYGIEKNIIMTEKDAVKCRDFATQNMYFLPINVSLDESFWLEFFRFLK